MMQELMFTSTITNKQRGDLTKRLEALAAPPGFTGKAPGGPTRWSTDRAREWESVKPKLVVEVRYDQVTGDRFRHGTKLIRWRPDRSRQQCTFDQLENPIFHYATTSLQLTRFRSCGSTPATASRAKPKTATQSLDRSEFQSLWQKNPWFVLQMGAMKPDQFESWLSLAISRMLSSSGGAK